MKKKKRTRTVLRAAQRSDAKLATLRTKLAALEPGGSESAPIVVASASVVEPRAESFRCLRCGDATRCTGHTSVNSAAGEALRVAELTCRACGAPRRLFFRIEGPLLH